LRYIHRTNTRFTASRTAAGIGASRGNFSTNRAADPRRTCRSGSFGTAAGGPARNDEAITVGAGAAGRNRLPAAGELGRVAGLAPR